jgi:hypothetical protein
MFVGSGRARSVYAHLKEPCPQARASLDQLWVVPVDELDERLLVAGS